MWKEKKKIAHITDSNVKLILMGQGGGFLSSELEKAFKAFKQTILYKHDFAGEYYGEIPTDFQPDIMNAVKGIDLDEVLVILGMEDISLISDIAETLITGIPSYNPGVLSKVALNLNVYHVCEKEIYQNIYSSETLYRKAAHFKDNDSIIEEMQRVRTLRK